MRFTLLRIFLSVAYTGSFSKAAQMEHMTQPAVSIAIASLEEELGCKLFDRISGQRTRISLTPAGEYFAEYAKRTMAEYKTMQSELLTKIQTVRPINLIITPTPASTVSPFLLRHFRSIHPNIPISARITHSIDVYAELLDGSADLCISGSKPEHPDVLCEAFYSDPPILIAPKSFNLKPVISQAEFKRLPLILRPVHSSNLTKLLLIAMQRANIDPSTLNVVAEVGSNADVLQAASLGTGVGFITRSLFDISADAHNVTMVSVRGFKPHRELYLSRKKDSAFPLEMKMFWDCAVSTEWRTDAMRLEINS